MAYRTGFEGRLSLSRSLSITETNGIQELHRRFHAGDVETHSQGTGATHQLWSGVHTCRIVDQWRASKVHTSKPVETQTHSDANGQWVESVDGTALVLDWNGSGRFSNQVPLLECLWCEYLIPRGVLLDGIMEWTGQDSMDSGILAVVNSKIYVVTFPSSYRLPLPTNNPQAGAISAPWPFRLDSEMFGRTMRERLQSILLAAQLKEAPVLKSLAEDTLWQLAEWGSGAEVEWEVATWMLRNLLNDIITWSDTVTDETLPRILSLLQVATTSTHLRGLLWPQGRHADPLPQPWLLTNANRRGDTSIAEMRIVAATKGSLHFSPPLPGKCVACYNSLFSQHMGGQRSGRAHTKAAPAVVVRQRHNVADPPTPQQLSRHAARPLAQNAYPEGRNRFVASSSSLQWDNSGEGNQFVAWLAYLIANFFIPWNTQLNGIMEWNGEEAWDSGVLIVHNNAMTVAVFPSANRLPFASLGGRVIPYVTEEHHVKRAIKERVMLMLLAAGNREEFLWVGSDAQEAVTRVGAVEVRKIANQLLGQDFGLTGQLLHVLQRMLLKVLAGPAGPRDVEAAITEMDPRLARYLLEDSPL